MLKTKSEITAALTSYRPDQAEVIHEMASTRGMDAENLTPADYRALIVEEAEFSVQASGLDAEERANEEKYAADLKAIAAEIEA